MQFSDLTESNVKICSDANFSSAGQFGCWEKKTLLFPYAFSMRHSRVKLTITK